MLTTKNKCGAKDQVKKDEVDSWATIFSESEKRIERHKEEACLENKDIRNQNLSYLHNSQEK